MRKSSLLFLLFIALSSPAISRQSEVPDKNLTWHSEQNVEKHSGLTMSTSVRIVSKARNSVDLIIQDQTMSFIIQSVSGAWTNENEDGQVIYSVMYNNVDSGKITITRSGGIAKITINFTEANPDGMHQEFTISRVEAN